MEPLPKSGTPKLSREEAEKIVKNKLGATAPTPVLIGIRGYYSKMGVEGKNDTNIYDDAIIVLGKDYQTFNANTDPSFVKKEGRALAFIKEGVYKFAKGKHRNKYNALRAYPEGVEIPCIRDGKESTAQYINIHMGGEVGKDTTWSEGCQTVPKRQWNKFIELVYAEMNKVKAPTITYILITNEEMKKILG
jgi:lysozyme